MRTRSKILHEFVEFIPKEREDGVLYVSIPFATAVHSCFCGCRTKVVTPISPVGWQLGFDGEAVSLTPSVGNWAFPCRSHYFIQRDTVVWAGDMSDDEVALGRAHDRSAREAYFGANTTPDRELTPVGEPKRKGLFARLFGRR